MTYNPNYHKRDIGEIIFLLQRVLKYENPMNNIRKIQDMVLDPLDICEDNLYEVTKEQEEVLADLAIDLEYFTDIKSHTECDILYIHSDSGKTKLIHIIEDAMSKLSHSDNNK
jgi:hypothetical protein